MNTHYSDLLMQIENCIIIPALSFDKDENLFVNLEGKPQKTLKAINGPTKARSIRKFFSTLLDANKISTTFSVFLEYLSKGNKSNADSKGQLFDCNYTNNNVKTLYSSYPLKSVVEDFYRTNNLLKNSPVMLECSNEVRKNSTNF